MKRHSLLPAVLALLFIAGCGKSEPSNPATPSGGGSTPTPPPPAPTEINLSETGTANCYMIQSAGTYTFDAVKGNSDLSVGEVSSVEVLWESFGTSTAPSVGDIIASVSYADGVVTFSTPDTFCPGNALIAAKDSEGTILWSWHIWASAFARQTYKNNAGIVMDRNLGALVATPGNVGSLGLLYQWGRKDPFLGSSDIAATLRARSTGTWPNATVSTATIGTIAWATANPMTFISCTGSTSSDNGDWYYTGDATTDDTRWQADKTLYDPCPLGWKVPVGGVSGLWYTAAGVPSPTCTFDDTNKGINFSGIFAMTGNVWFPAPGQLNKSTGSLESVGSDGRYWTCSVSTLNAKFGSQFYFYRDENVSTTSSGWRANANSIRCVQE